MVNKHCCYGKCNSDSRYAHREYMKGVFFVNFPKPNTDLEKCRLWVSRCCRQNFSIENVSKYTVICSKHFVGGQGPTEDHPHPLPATATPMEVARLSRKKARKPPIPRSPASATTPSHSLTPRTLFLSDSTHLSDHMYAALRVEIADSSVEDSVSGEFPPMEIDFQPASPPMTDAMTKPVVVTVKHLKPTFVSVETQTDIALEHLQSYTDSQLISISCMKRTLFMNDVQRDDKSCKFYTGLTLSALMLVFNLLRPIASRMTYWEGAKRQQPPKATADARKRGPLRTLTLFEEFVLTLVRIRRAMDVETLQDLFGISATRVSRIFSTWINLMFHELSFLVRWPDKEQTLKTLPDCFKPFRKTRAIIDCTEFFIHRPSVPSSQRITWSSYKSHNTLKALVAIAPTGAFTFVSNLWTGSASDKKLVEQSGFLQLVEYGDDIMADRGFLIRDLLALRGATLNIPPFASGCQLSNRAATKTRRIARARIHVERAIGRLKQFKLLSVVLPLNIKNLLDQIVFVSAALCNLDKPLAK